LSVKTNIRKTKKFQSLTATLAIAFSALIIAVMLIASSLQMYFSFKVQKKDLIANQRLIAQNAANTVKGYIQQKFSILETIASRNNPATITQEDQKPVLERLLGIEPAFRQLVLLNTKNEEQAKVSRLSNSVSYGFIKQIDNSLFTNVTQGRTYIGSVYIDETTSEPIVIMAVPVTDVFGVFKGTLIAETNLKFMWDLVGGIKIGENGLAYVVDNQGNLIAFGDISRVLRGENLIHLSEVNEFVKGDSLIHKDSAEIVKGIQGNLVVANDAHLGIPDWAVVVELPVLEAYETVITTLIISGLIMLLSFASAVIAGIYMSKKITKPIIKLRDGAVEIGKGRLDTQIEIETNDEIEDLANAFNQMARYLRTTTTSIDNLNREIAERKRAEQRQAQLLEKLEKTNIELNDFLHLASHDMKTPLRGIATLANWISDDYTDKFDNNGKEKINLLITRVDRMYNMIRGILRYSSLISIEEEKIVLDLNEILMEVIHMIAPPENITITIENKLPVIKCEKTPIIQLFKNLISNAVSNMDKPQGLIKIGCKEENDFWKFSVADNGPGIEEKYFEKVFQLFKTLSTFDESQSTGIGLSLVKKIVEMHGGKVWIESQPGLGSTFCFTLTKQESEVINEKLEANIVS
jgi:signal transduction histidine kinase